VIFARGSPFFSLLIPHDASLPQPSPSQCSLSDGEVTRTDNCSACCPTGSHFFPASMASCLFHFLEALRRHIRAGASLLKTISSLPSPYPLLLYSLEEDPSGSSRAGGQALLATECPTSQRRPNRVSPRGFPSLWFFARFLM